MIRSVKKYIGENKLIRNSILLFTGLAMLMIMVIAVQEKMQSGVKEFRVDIEYIDQTKRLINDEFIFDLLRKELGYNIERVKIKDLDLLKVEAFLSQNKFVEEVEVYIDGDNNIIAEISQKNPIVRLNHKDRHFYLDKNGDYLPLSPVAAVRVPVITGHIEDYNPNYKLEEKHQYKDIFELATKIASDQLLSSLIEQIHIKKNNEFLLIPKIGKEKIILGDIHGLEDKLFNLKHFYKEGLTREGWGKYAYLDLRNEGQVVAQNY